MTDTNVPDQPDAQALLNPGQLEAALRARAQGNYPAEAAVELVFAHGTWSYRAEFISLFEVCPTFSDDGLFFAPVDGARAGELVGSSSEVQMLAIAGELVGNDSGGPLASCCPGSIRPTPRLCFALFSMSEEVTRLGPSPCNCSRRELVYPAIPYLYTERLRRVVISPGCRPLALGSPVAMGGERLALSLRLEGTPMSVNHPVSASARQRAREHQRATTKAVATVEAASGRQKAAQGKRAEVLAAQDGLVAAAQADLFAAIAGLSAVVGVEVAAGLLDLPKAEVRRAVTAREEAMAP
ncbi:MAG: hypothetical protein M3Y91_19535 [Actinomycetota bacterium]|nr:hypothetical protein [Actinomycetota bacterium]